MYTEFFIYIDVMHVTFICMSTNHLLVTIVLAYKVKRIIK